MTVLATVALSVFAVWGALRLARAAGLYDGWLDAMGRDESEGAR